MITEKPGYKNPQLCQPSTSLLVRPNVRQRKQVRERPDDQAALSLENHLNVPAVIGE